MKDIRRLLLCRLRFCVGGGLVLTCLVAGCGVWRPDDIGRREPVRIWTAPDHVPHVTGMIAHPTHGIFVSLTGSFRRDGKGFHSELWHSRDAKAFARVWEGPVETVGQGMILDDEIHWPVEHGARIGGHSLVWRDDRVQAGPAVAAPWAIMAGEGYIPYNDGYVGGRNGFGHDKARWVDVETGQVEFRSDVPGFVRSIFMYRGKLSYTVNYADPLLVIGNTSYSTRMLRAASRGGTIYGGGGVLAGAGEGDGRIYRWRRGKETVIGHVGGQSCESLYADRHHILLGFINPDEVFEINHKGEPRLIASIPGDRKNTGGWAFGCGLAKWQDNIYWARSDNSRTHVYLLARPDS